MRSNLPAPVLHFPPDRPLDPHVSHFALAEDHGRHDRGKLGALDYRAPKLVYGLHPGILFICRDEIKAGRLEARQRFAMCYI
jgi:hypothetical protein